MRNEPERFACFQREVSLKVLRGLGSSEDDREPDHTRTPDPGSDPGFHRPQRAAWFRATRSLIGLRVAHSGSGPDRPAPPPRPEGQPGYLRVDSVHQGDQDGIKGLCHINLVDEVTQFQFVGTVERINERFLAPILQGF